MKKASVKQKRRKSAERREAKRGETPNALRPYGFQKGNPGKKPGTKNKLGVKLKEAILEAAERSGRDGKGKDGAVGYLVWLSRAEPAGFGRMLEKVMPLQVEVADKTDRTMTPREAVERLEDKGLPVPPALRSLAEGIAHAVQERQDQDYDAELNGEGYEGAGEPPIDGEVRPDGEEDDDAGTEDRDAA